MSLKKGTIIPTIDVALVTLTTTGEAPQELAIDTATKIGVSPEIETVDAVKLVIKGKLKAQKPAQKTLTGNTILLTDNVFTPELVQILQGGTITFDSSEPKKITGYTPKKAGEEQGGEIFILNAYSAIYNSAGIITGYEKISYPNCQGSPVSFSAEDGVFRVSEYTINSYPEATQAPYDITYVDELPTVV